VNFFNYLNGMIEITKHFKNWLLT